MIQEDHKYIQEAWYLYDEFPVKIKLPENQIVLLFREQVSTVRMGNGKSTAYLNEETWQIVSTWFGIRKMYWM